MPNPPVKKALLDLTTVQGALLAAPLIVAVGLLLSTYDQGTSQAKTQEAPASQTVQQAKPEKSAPEQVKSPEKRLFSDVQKAEIGTIIREYLLKNPEILQQVGEELARRQQQELEKKRVSTLAKDKNEIFNSPLDFALGDKDTNVTIVEYFDYNCGWCKRALNEVTKLTEADSKIRIVMKEFPIFGEHSEFAARAAMASKAQGKYWDYHNALMKERRVTKDNALKIAEKVGIDVEMLKTEMKDPKYTAAIKRTQRIAVSLGIEGTPGFIIDDKIRPGFVPATQLKAIVTDIRKAGCKFC